MLAALEAQLGIGDETLDLVVGTSAGSAVAAYLRSGYAAREMLGRAEELGTAAPGPLATNPVQLLRRGVGSAYIIARSTIRIPGLLSLVPSPSLRRAFPAGVVSMGAGLDVLERELPRSWPERPLWLAAYDLVSRRRVVLGSGQGPYLPLPQAVQASCAIPGVYTPVRVGGGVLVDGGAWSLTNLDLAALGRADRVICVAPMSYDRLSPPPRRDRIAREVATRLLERQVARLSRQGIAVLCLSPGAREASCQGLNLMRSKGLGTVAEVAYEETSRRLAALPDRALWERQVA